MESLSLAHARTHRHTHSLLEVLCVKARYFVLSTFNCHFHGGLVKSTSFATKNYNKQRKLETRQTFWGTADVHRRASQRGSVSTVLKGNVYKWEFTVGDRQLIPIRIAFWDTFHSPGICRWVGCPDLIPGERKWNRKGWMCWQKPDRTTLSHLKEKRFWDDFIYKAEPPVEAAELLLLCGPSRGNLWFSLRVQEEGI